MPAMPRVRGKATKIAYAILGVPENMKSKKTKHQRYIDRRLKYDETMRIK